MNSTAPSLEIEIELNPRERRFYDRLRERLRAPAPGDGSDLRDLLFLLPDLVVLMMRLLRDERVAPGDKAVALLGVGYILSPVDLVPEFLFGPVGLIDDLLVVAATLSRLVNHVHPDVVRAHWPGQGDALHAIHRLTSWSERQVGGRLRRVVRRFLG